MLASRWEVLLDYKDQNDLCIMGVVICRAELGPGAWHSETGSSALEDFDHMTKSRTVVPKYTEHVNSDHRVFRGNAEV